MTVEFVHLRVHSDFSLVDGIVKHKPLLEALKERQLPAVAITDECNLYGVIKFYKASLSAGIKPIIGCDLQIQVAEDNYQLTLLAETNVGYENLVNLISKAYLQSDRKNGIPLIQKKWLTPEILKGLIGLSGGIEGEIGHAIEVNNITKAEELINYYKSIFKEESFFLELQRIGKDQEETYISHSLMLAEKTKTPLVATNAVRFINQEDYDVHEVRVGIYEGYTLLDEKRKSRYSEQQYLKSAGEMVKLFGDIPSALKNTVLIAKRCNVSLKLGNPVLPSSTIPENMTEKEYFTQVSFKGLEKRLEHILSDKKESKPDIRKQYEQRLQTEMDVICEMGFQGYFLIVTDFIQWAKDNQVPVGPGRGSGAGSIVAYALEITDIDPLPYNLLFERFLNPERVSMPDFDIDFCIDGRDRVIDYVANKYGIDSVSQIITFGSMAAKAVIRDVGRVLAHPYGFVDRIAKLVPNDLGIKLKDACATGTELRQLADEDEAVAGILEVALKLEGTIRSVGKHAAGVVISPTLITDFAPIYCEEGTHQLVTQFDKYDVEEAGLVKFDFLGLRNLTIIDKALKIINAERKKLEKTPINITSIKMTDDATFALLKRAETTGVFQLESGGMKELIKKLLPDCFEDIIALVALYRPGPLGSGMVDDFVNRKHGRQRVSYPHPKLEPVLQETYGTILYQEQVMQIAQVLANYSLGGADILRRAMGKKNPAEMAKQRSVFEEGCSENNIDADLANNIFDLMEEFAKYGFNKSHSAAYALISYQTAWLKAHYPAEFMAALLSSDMDKTEKVVNFIIDAKNIGVKIILPHVNRSYYEFTVNKQGEVIYGLGAIKGAGHAAVEMIINERFKNGDYKDIFDFARRIDLKKANKRILEALVYAGCLDGLAKSRAELLATLPNAIKASEQMAKSLLSGQYDLFGFAIARQDDNNDLNTNNANVSFVQTDEWSLKETLQLEKSVLGMSLSAHMIDEAKSWLQRLNTKPLIKLEPSHRKVVVKIAGVISNWIQRQTKKGNKTMGVLTIDDSTDQLEILVFSPLYEQVKNMFKIDDIVVIESEVSIDNYSGKLRINTLSIKHLNEAILLAIKNIKITCDLKSLNTDNITIINKLLNNRVENDLHIPLNIYCTSPEFDVLFPVKNCFISSVLDVDKRLMNIEGVKEINYQF